MAMQDKLLEELTCPITFELFDDPISVPCCGKTFSRKALCDALKSQINNRNSCPLCNGDLSEYDPQTAPSNKNILSFLELVKNQQEMKDRLNIISNLKKQQSEHKQNVDHDQHKESPKQQWAATIKTMYNIDETQSKSPIAQLQITLNNGTFELIPSLFIIAVDKSGSMSGSAWNQVKTALKHIGGITASNTLIKTGCIVYDSSAQTLGSITEVDAMLAGGGTNFQSAFDQIKDLFIRYKDDCIQHKINETVTICFLTDGRDNCSRSKQQLVPNFKSMLNEYWVKGSSVIVHTIGFGSSCDKAFLEELRTEKSGTFRYAEPGDADEMLCTKMKSLFEKISESTSVPIKIDLKDCYRLFKFYTPPHCYVDDDDDDEKKTDHVIDIQFPVSSNGSGVYTQWIEWTARAPMDEKEERPVHSICIDSEMDKDRVVSIRMEDDNNMESNMDLLSTWILSLTDDLATQIYNLSNKYYSNYNEFTFDLHCALIQQNCEALQDVLGMDSKSFIALSDKIEYLLNSIIALREGLSINMGKISDLRFGSQFESSSRQATSNKHCDRQEQLEEKYRQIDLFGEDKKASMKREILYKYPFDNTNRDRNALQEMIMNMENDDDIIKYLNSDAVTHKDILHCDADGNNTMSLCCYVGKFNVVRELFSKYKKIIDIEYTNHDQETALTLAIKKRGYYHTIRVLLSEGAQIDEDRSEALEQFSINHNYIITAKLIRDLRTNSSDPNRFMSAEYLVYLYQDAVDNNKDIDIQKYLELFLRNKMEKYVKLMIHKHGAVPDIDLLLSYCIPPKSDDPETDKYLNLCKIVMATDESLIKQRNAASETALFKAAEKGSLAHCEYFISLGAEIDAANELGNTPLWVSTAKVYPCIMKLLISSGADVNHQNIKGNPPLYNLCIRGNEKMCNILLSTNKVKIENVSNKNGDTLILICCRNKNWKILPLLLNYVSLEFVNFRAHIDGFNAIFSSVETESVECIKILHQFGVSLNQKTDDDNPIIAGATPLHLACYYKRYEAAKVLMSLGADVNALDNIHQQIPLTLAVIQLNFKIIKLLARKSNILLKDIYGNTPVSYCQNNMEIRKLLINPLLDILCGLCFGKFNDYKQEAIALNVMNRYCGLKGCFDTKDALNIMDSDGMTPLLYAVINKKADICKVLLSLNADPNIKNKYGLNCFIFNEWIKNIKIAQWLRPYCLKLSKDEQQHIKEAVCRLQEMNEKSWFNSFTLNINNLNGFNILTYSGIEGRMQNFIEHITTNVENKYINKTQQLLLKLDCNDIVAKYDENTVQQVFRYSNSNTKAEFDENKYGNIILNSKLFTINFIAGNGNGNGKEEDHEAKDVFLLNLVTNNEVLCNAMNHTIINELDDVNMNILHSIKVFNNILTKIPCFIGEVFIGCNKELDRSLFLVNTVFSWNAIISGSTQWRMAINNLPDFTAKKSVGTVFLVKSKTGKHIGRYSQFSFESEVIFKQNTKFKVNEWYRGDVICLAQENIRKQTFGIPFDEEMKKYVNSKKALIIEVQEVEEIKSNK